MSESNIIVFHAPAVLARHGGSHIREVGRNEAVLLLPGEQEVLVEELVAAVDSLQRYAVSQALTWCVPAPPQLLQCTLHSFYERCVRQPCTQQPWVTVQSHNGELSLAIYAISRVLGSPPAMAGASALRALGPWRPLLLPLPTPLELLSRYQP